MNLGAVTGGLFAGTAALPMAGGVISNEQNRRTANKQMRFQKYMSNSSHQREVSDLKAAGLNPLLSANTGASTPAGAASMASDVITPGVQAGLQSIQTLSDVALKAEQTTQTGAQTKLTGAQTGLTQAQTKFQNVSTRAKLKEATKGEVIDKVWQHIDKLLGYMEKTAAKPRSKEPFFEPNDTKINELYHD